MTRLAVIMLLCIGSQLQAADAPYDVMVLDTLGHLGRTLSTILQVDMDSREVHVWPSEAFYPTHIATTPDGSMYGISSGGYIYELGQFDFQSHQWEVHQYPDGPGPGIARDLDGMPDGNLAIIVDDGGVSTINTQTGGVQHLPMGFSDSGPWHLAVAPSGTIVADWVVTTLDDDLNWASHTALSKFEPGAAGQERIDFDTLLGRFEFESNNTMIEIENGLSRVNLDSATVTDLNIDNPALEGLFKAAMAPDGRLVGLTREEGKPNTLVRIDLDTGTTEVRELDTSYAHDLEIRIIPDPRLQAGDSDQDLDFDQLDLVHVQVVGKYLTGQPATWGEGDWNGAPGGTPGNPPVGDGMFDQLDIVAALQSNTYLTGPYAAIRSGGARNDDTASIVYDAATGEVAVDPPASERFTSVDIASTAQIFTGPDREDDPICHNGSIDIDCDAGLFKAVFGSDFGYWDFGKAAAPGLAEEFLLSDLKVQGTFLSRREFASNNVDLIYIPVPEPATVLLLGAGVCMLAVMRRLRP